MDDELMTLTVGDSVVESEEEPVGERIQEILEKGSALFAQKGYDGTSMRDIAKAAGVSKALLYHHFASKDELYARVSFYATKDLYEFVEDNIPTQGGAGEKLRAFMIAAATFFSEHRSSWIAASNAFWSDPDRHRQETRIAKRRQFELRLRSIIKEGIDSGEFRPVDPAMAGRLVLSGINWMHRWFDSDKELSAEEVIEQYADMLLGGLITR